MTIGDRPVLARSIPFSPPNVGDEEVAAVVEALRSGWITTGPRTAKFEADFAEYVRAPAALGLNSCTAGLHLALEALGIGPGDVVATTTMTFAASVNVIEHVGARPLLVDVEPDTLNMSLDSLRERLVPEVKAIIPVHYGGHPVDMDGLTEIAEERSIPLIEDAAHALPSFYRGRPIGSSEHFCAFSFYPTKNITSGEGGMLTGSPELIERARMLSLHGLSKDASRRYSKGASWRYEILAPGFKYNMTDLTASLGLAQLKKLPAFQERRRRIVDAYNRGFADLDAVQTPVEWPEVDSSLHLYVIRLRPQRMRLERDEVIVRLSELGIGTSVHFIPIHLHPYYKHKYGYEPQDYPVALDAYQRMLSLPLHSGLDDDDLEYVIEAVRDVVGGS
jgi:dTDP-4-amino-4,6-dideoxygalactose transaminase